MATAAVIEEFPPGVRPTVRGTFTDEDDVPTAPTSVEVIVYPPTGASTTYATPDATIELGDPMVPFTFPAPITTPGKWRVKMTALAGVQTSRSIYFIITRT